MSLLRNPLLIAYHLGLFLLIVPLDCYSQWGDFSEISFSVTVSVQENDQLQRKTPISIYERILTTDNENRTRVDSFRSLNNSTLGKTRLPRPQVLGEKTMDFTFPAVIHNDVTDSLRLEFLNSSILILTGNLESSHVREININTFEIADNKTADLIIDLLYNGFVTDDEGRRRNVTGVNIDLAVNKINLRELESNFDVLKIKPENVRLVVEKLPDRSLGENVIRLDEYKQRLSTTSTFPTDIISLNQLHARCEVVYQ